MRRRGLDDETEARIVAEQLREITVLRVRGLDDGRLVRAGAAR